MTTILDRILGTKRGEVAARKAACREAYQEPPFASADDHAADLAFAADASLVDIRDFKRAIDTRIAEGGLALIAEIKKASPSKGLIRAEFDPPAHARAYAAGGATCLSVLTDGPYFQGSDDDLIAARDACPLPVLRKDFIVDPWQVIEARRMGADAVLAIVAALDDGLLHEIDEAAGECGMSVLVEVHDDRELERAYRLKSRLIGVNNRNLKDFVVDFDRTLAVLKDAPAGITFVAESGIGSHADVRHLADHGIRAFLVGESLMRQPDLAAATRALLHG